MELKLYILVGLACSISELILAYWNRVRYRGSVECLLINKKNVSIVRVTVPKLPALQNTQGESSLRYQNAGLITVKGGRAWKP